MGWHLRPLATTCVAVGCYRVATQELHNEANEPCARYCEAHASAALTHATEEWAKRVKP